MSKETPAERDARYERAAQFIHERNVERARWRRWAGYERYDDYDPIPPVVREEAESVFDRDPRDDGYRANDPFDRLEREGGYQ